MRQPNVPDEITDLVILISGRGSNMQAIVEANIPNTRIALVIANRPNSTGLDWAAGKNIPTAMIDHQHYASREAFDEALIQVIDSHAALSNTSQQASTVQPKRRCLVLLAGFMRVLTPVFTTHYAGRLLNIHPSLLPAFPGLHTHQRAIDAGCKLAGCTVHFVDAELDHGPIVAQIAVPIHAQDTAEALAARVLVEEHKLYPSVVRAWVEGRIKILGRRVEILPELV